MDGDAGRGAGLGSERYREVARILALAEVQAVRLREGVAGEDRHAVVALLAAVGDVRIAERAQLLERKAVVRALRLLQAKNVRPFLLQEPADLLDAQTDGVDV